MQKIIIPILSISLLSSIIYASSIETNPETIIEKENRETILECLEDVYAQTGSTDMIRQIKECESIPLRSITWTHSTGSSVLPPKWINVESPVVSVTNVADSQKNITKVSEVKNQEDSSQNGFWKTYEIAIPLIRKYEWMHLKAYWDYNWYSIGYGTRAKHAFEVITQAEADARLWYIVKQVVERVQRDFPTLSSEQQAGLVSFAYNCEKWYRSVRDNWLEYHKSWCRTAWWKVLQGLVDRRTEEAQLIFK